MEAILTRYDEERRHNQSLATAKNIKKEVNRNHPSDADVNISVELEKLICALRDILPSLEERRGDDGETKTSDHVDDKDGNKNHNNAADDDGAIDSRWLIRTLRPLTNDEDHLSLMALLVYEATKKKNQQQQEEALFAALGASEEAMTALFTIVPNADKIRQNITMDSLQKAGGVDAARNDNNSNNTNGHDSSSEDPLELERRRLREDAYEAAQIAAIAQAEADAVGTGGGISSHATHSITRSSEQALIKAARKAQKRANQTLEKAKAAGAVIDENELYQGNGNYHGLTMGAGGLLNRSEDDLRAMQASLASEGSRVRYNDATLPSGTIREDYGDYEKVTIPPPQLDPESLHERLRLSDIFVNETERDCAAAFKGTDSLNPMQSTCFKVAFHRRENMLVCAPTGAGKTNVAMLAVTAHFRDVGLLGGDSDDDRNLETGKKVVYIAPMKALAQEVVEKFSSKLKPLGLIVRELTGDMQLTRAEAQSANIIVTTPEKWDVVTRKSGADDNSLGNQCGLLIIDEVHLLADDRGAVIESVVGRLHRLVESRQRQIRIVGLSATLPNYKDVAEFLQVPEVGLFYFGPEHRPVPLQQTFVGVTGNIKDRFLMEKKMNDVCYDIVKDSLARGYQVMVFVHSRKGTGETATALASHATAAGELDRYFITQGKDGGQGDAYKRYSDRIKKSRNREVTNHFYNGLGIHHAGMLRGDRKLTENMFADGAIKVLCCTATLAWGVNLPAHTVVVKGTDIYNPEKGKMVDLSILDVQQIFGRAGRPQYDTSGEANLITNHHALNRYLDKLVRAVPIESNFIKQLADHLNAEVVGGTVTNLQEAATWLSYTYMYVRMLKNPLAYGISADQKNDDPSLRGRLLEMVQDAATALSQEKMLSFDPRSGNLSMTTLGRVAAHFYIQAESVANFNDAMTITPYPNDANILHIITSANEFLNLRVRQEEQKELDNLQAKCPLPLEGPVNDSATKTFVMIQGFISRDRPKGFTLISDTNYIASNAGRVARAIFEMCLYDNKAGSALKFLRVAKSIDNQFWWFQTPLRHFEGEIGVNIIKAIESRHHSGTKTGYDSLSSALSLLEMTPEEVGQICRSKKNIGAKVQRFIGMIPKPKISCNVQPVTNSVLRFQIELLPDFEWHGRWHGGAVFFWLWVEDAYNERIYHQEQVMFTKKAYPDAVNLEMYIPTFTNSTQYLVRIVSDSWVGVELIHPISLEKTRMPEQVTSNTDLMDLTPLPITVLQDEKYEQLFTRIETFNPVQSQLFHVLYHTDIPVLLGAPTGSGKTVVGELSILRMKRIHKDGICVYIAPLKSLARERLKEWRKRFGDAPMHWKVLELSGDTHHDRRALDRADILVCTPEKWDLISRGWNGNSSQTTTGENKRSFVKRVRLLVIDEIHLLGEERGAVLEAIVSRTRFISRSLQQKPKIDRSSDATVSDMVRIVGLSTAVANPCDLADWIGISSTGSGSTARQGLYNFRPSIRPVPTTVHVQGYPGKHYCPRMATMNKPCYAAIKQHSPDRPSLIFVASRRQTRLTAFDLISFAACDEDPKMFLHCDDQYIDAIATSIKDEALQHTITFGIGLHHAGLSSGDRDIVERLYLSGEIRVLVATATLAWGVNLPARLVIVKGTEFYDGKLSRYVDYPLTDVLQMIGRAGRPGYDTEGTAVVLVESSKKNFYKKFLYTPFPVESCLRGRICENMNAEIASNTINSTMDAIGYLCWTFFARRVKANPSYYGAKSSSPEHVEEFLSSVAVDTLNKLKEQGCVEVDEDNNVHASILGNAASKFYLDHRTSKQMKFGLRQCAKMIIMEKPITDKETKICYKLHAMEQSSRLDEISIAWILYTLCCTHEFDELPVRHNEELLNEELSESLMWGADTSAITSVNGKSGYIDSEVYGDSHTKGFLLVQAYLERSKLPISDYINDSKTVMDSVPRLLAAMQFIASQEETNDGSFDVLCQLVRTKQLLSTRSTLQMNPGTQLAGLNDSAFLTLLKKLNAHKGGKINEENSLWNLRRFSRKTVTEVLKKCRVGTVRTPIHKTLDTLYAMPLITFKDGKLYHEIDKTTGKSIGTLKLSLQVQREEKRNNVFTTLSLILGSFENQKLLAHSDEPISKNGSWTIQTVLKFDWKIANSDGGDDGGRVILRLLLDSVRGLDSELVFRLM